MSTGSPRCFQLYRRIDLTGVSGTGIVADGVQWPDYTVTIRWRGARPSTVCFGSIQDAIAVHGHEDATTFVWLDTRQPALDIVGTPDPGSGP